MPETPFGSLILGQNPIHPGYFVELAPEERRRHQYLIGASGTGKTTQMVALARQAIWAGEGVAFIDPHGDAAHVLADCIPKHRMKDVVFFDAAKTETPLAFNPLHGFRSSDPSTTVSTLMSCFENLWANSWGPRLAYVLRHALTTLLHQPTTENVTLLHVARLLTDEPFRWRCQSNLSDPICRSFWEREYNVLDARQRAEWISPILNKVGAFSNHVRVRNIIGQAKSSFDVRRLMDTRKVLIVSLSKGALGEDGCALLGALLVAQIQAAAYGRAQIPEAARADFSVFLDEFQSFAAPQTFAALFSEARKYRINLTVSHQYTDQLPEELRHAVFGNVGTLCAFGIGPSDAAALALEYAPFNLEELTTTPRGEYLLRYRKNGVLQSPQRVQTAPLQQGLNSRLAVERLTHHHYGRRKTRSQIEGVINRQITEEVRPPSAKRARA